MRRFAASHVLVLVAVGMLQGVMALKPQMYPAEEEILIQEGDVLEIKCKGEGKLQFSTERNVAWVNQSEFNISFDNDSGWYTFTRSNAIKEDTGWYACAEEGIEIQNDEMITDHPDTNISWLYVYVNSSEPFVIDTYDGIRNLGNLPVFWRSKSDTVLPCRPTSPDLPVILEIRKAKSIVVPVPENTTYDPKIGFTINSQDYDSLQDARSFRCKINTTDRMPALRPTFNSHISEYTVIRVPQLPHINEAEVAHAIVGEDLILLCTFCTSIFGERVSAYWKVPESVPIERRGYNEVLAPIYQDPSKNIRFRNWRICHLQLTIHNVKRNDRGNYTCAITNSPSGGHYQSETTQVYVSERAKVRVPVQSRYVNLNQSTTIWCDVTGYPLKNYKWFKISDSKSERVLNRKTLSIHQRDFNDKTRMYIDFEPVSRSDNGTYECRVTDYSGLAYAERGRSHLMEKGEEEDYSGTIIGNRTDLIVTEVPEVRINFTTSGGADSIYLNWTIHDGNRPVNKYSIERIKNETTEWIECLRDTSGKISSYVATGLEKSTAYRFRITANNSIGTSQPAYSEWVRTLDKDPEFVPKIWINETVGSPVTIEWSTPPLELADHVHCYKVRVTHGTSSNKSTFVSPESSHYTFGKFESGIKYFIKIAACSNYTNECGNWSNEIENIVIDEDPAFIPNISIVQSTSHSIKINWSMPQTELRERVHQYKLLATNRTDLKQDQEPFYINKTENSYVFEGLEPSTYYEMKVAACSEYRTRCWDWSSKGRVTLAVDEGKVLGSGAFGIVRKARAESICKGQRFSTVAVKMVRATHRLDHMMALQRELKILAHLGKHLNVVNLLGACTKKISYGQLLVIVEFCRFGNLHDYLLRRRSDFVDQVDFATGNIAGTSFRIDCVEPTDSGVSTAQSDGDPTMDDCSQSTGSGYITVPIGDPASVDDSNEPVQVSNYEGDFTDSDLKPIGTWDLLCWAWQVSRGMNYLTSKKVVHGDLAARNILLADNNVVKICDFGLAKSLYAGDIYKREGTGPLPIKWMAVESIRDRVYSVKSDVWSFGVVMWEFFTLAETPYPEIPNEGVYQKLSDGFRMERPKYATEQIYRVMLSCWDSEPSKRPSFEEIIDIIDDLLDEKVKDHYVDFDVAYEQINAEALAAGAKDYLTMNPAEYASGSAEPKAK